MSISTSTPQGSVQAVLAEAQKATSALYSLTRTNNSGVVPSTDAQLKALASALQAIGYGTTYPYIVTNKAVRIWQMNASYTTPQSGYNGSGLAPFPAGGGDGTCMAITDFPADCEAIQIIHGNMSTTQPRRVIGFTAIAPDSLGDSIRDADFATAPVGTFNGGAAFVDVPIRDAAGTSCGMAVSDVYPITTQARADAPEKRRLLFIREAANYPVGNDNVNYPVPYVKRTGAGWANDPAGILLATGLPGNRLNSAWLASAPPSAGGNCQIMGVIFHLKGGRKASTILMPGSSLVKNDLNTPSTKVGSGFPLQSAIAASTDDHVIEIINAGQAGQTLDRAVIAATEAFRALPGLITHTCIEFANPNNLSAPTVAQINTLRSQADALINMAESNKSRPMLWNGWGRNVASAPFLASYYTASQDTLRRFYLEEMRNRGYPYLDTNVLMNRGSAPDAVKMVGSGDPYNYVNPTAGDALHQTNEATTLELTPAFTKFWQREVIGKY